MALPSHKKEFLQAVGFQAEEIAAVEETMNQMAQKAQAQGIQSKEAAPAATEQPAVETKPVETEEPKKEEPQTQDVDTQVKQAQEFIVKALEPILAPLTAEIASLKAEVANLKQQGTTTLTPAASALAAKSITQQQGEHVISGKGDKGPKENNSDKGPKENNSDKEAPVNSITGVTFLDNLIALNQPRPQGN